MEWWLEAESALTEVRHAVVGGVAAAAYMPGRQTDNIDIAVAVLEAGLAEDQLRKHGWQMVGPPNLALGTIWRNAEGNELDLKGLDEPWTDAALDAAARNRIVGLPTMSLPYLALMKLKAGRLTDMGDLARMLALADNATREATRALVATHGDAADAEDLDQVMELGDLEAGN